MNLRLIAKLLPDQNFFNVKCSTVSELTTLLDITAIDGYTLINYDIVMVKDQSTTSNIDNGIYRLEFGNLVKYTGVSILENSELIGFYIENGFVNGKSMPSTDYWCKIILKDNQVFQGHFTLIR